MPAFRSRKCNIPLLIFRGYPIFALASFLRLQPLYRDRVWGGRALAGEGVVRGDNVILPYAVKNEFIAGNDALVLVT